MRNFLFFKNKFLITLIFFPFIYFLGWILISIAIIFFPSLEFDKSLYGTIITFFLFLISLPYWIKIRWEKTYWQVFGIFNFRDKNSLSIFLIEFFKALVIILTISTFLIISDSAYLKINYENLIIFNSIFLLIFVGFAEELVFRVWLFEELRLNFSLIRANFLQAAIFAIIHLRYDFDLISNIQMFIGLFLLGIYLNQWRFIRNSSVLSPVIFHGALVGIWFMVNNSFLDIQNGFSKILFGPGTVDNINPIGGILGISILMIINISQRNLIASNFFYTRTK